MTGAQFRNGIATLGLSQQAAGDFFFGSPRSARRWVIDGPPPLVAVTLDLMLDLDLTPADVRPEWKMPKRGRPEL